MTGSHVFGEKKAKKRHQNAAAVANLYPAAATAASAEAAATAILRRVHWQIGKPRE